MGAPDLALRSAKYFAVCHDCRLFHRCPDGTNELFEFLGRHRGHQTDVSECGSPAKIAGYHGNASVKEAFGTATAFTITNANLASSATAGWVSNAITNSSNLYLDALVMVQLAAVNTAPASDKAIYLFAYGLIDTGGSVYTSTGAATPSGSEGTLTFPDVSAAGVIMPRLGTIPYPVQNIANNGGPFAIGRCFSGILPPKWGVAMVNYSGMTLNVTSIKYIEVYNTVA